MSSNPSESGPSTSILDHYGGFAQSMTTTPDSSNRIAYPRKDSDHSITTASSSNHISSVTRMTRADSSFPLPSPLNTPSLRSSSSSLRQTVDMLKAGVFPPGLQRVRSKRVDSSSDGSHYDDEDSEDHGFQVETGDPFGSAQSRLNQSLIGNNSDVFSNALDSPLVPMRRSSQHSSQHSSHIKRGSDVTSLESTSRKSRFEEEQVGKSEVAANIPLSPSLSAHSTPPKKINSITAMGRTLTDVPKLSTQKDVDLENAISLAAEKDPNRPKTLKEARAFAKERARLRLQAKEGSDLSSSMTLDTPPIQLLQEETSTVADKELPLSSLKDSTFADSSAVRSPDSSSEWRGHSRQLATPVTPKGEEAEQKREIIASEVSPEKSAAQAMEDLQTAVGEAIQDLSFSSSTATGETLNSLESAAYNSANTPTMKLVIPSSRGDIENESSAISVASFTSAQDFGSAQDLKSKSRRESYLQSPERDANYTSTREDISTSPEPEVMPLTPSTIHNSSSPQNSPENSTFVPHRLHSQQRSTAPNKIARLDIYGKTVPWPPAFNPAAIIEQRRLAPWERARSYAHYCNDLTSTSTGLQVWMEMVQRPVHHFVVPVTPIKKHLRGDATDHSGYAASVRSDATFPMRGDGARAKEFVAHIPAVINESPPNLLPHNIPYPMLVQQTGRSSSSSFDDHSSTPTSISRPGFFTSLGRKSSSRRTPGTGSLSSFSALSSSTSNNAIRSRGRPKMISSPMNLNSSASLANIKSGFENFTNTPELITSSPSTQAVQSRFPPSSSPSLPAPPNRTPMGPRAQLSTAPALQFPETEVVRRGSGASTGSYDKTTTDYRSSDARISPTINPPKSSLTYVSVRDNLKNSPKGSFSSQQPSVSQAHLLNPSDSSQSKSNGGSRRSSHQVAPPTSAENEALDKLSDVLPDADRITLLEHLRKAGNNDLLAIGSYLQANALNEGKVFLQ